MQLPKVWHAHLSKCWRLLQTLMTSSTTPHPTVSIIVKVGNRAPLPVHRANDHLRSLAGEANVIISAPEATRSILLQGIERAWLPVSRANVHGQQVVFFFWLYLSFAWKPEEIQR